MKAPCRRLGLADYAQARTLYECLSTGDTLPEAPEGRAAFRKILEHPGTQIIGALDGKTLVSMATLHILPNMTWNARPYALIENVATLQSHEGRGFGRAVMQAAAEAAWAENVYKIMLLTGHANGVKGFYQKLGYKADEKHGLILRRS